MKRKHFKNELLEDLDRIIKKKNILQNECDSMRDNLMAIDKLLRLNKDSNDIEHLKFIINECLNITEGIYKTN